ncbi:hypothetical protein ACH9EU_10055 [Kocuria sp. M1R5S2]|uniref:hypothetical protein n=1 Tax=Kocuria rhizosphaerae TaxID=3376285 RepID=UPI00378E9BBE
MDDRSIARAQARLIRTTISDAGLSVHDVWQTYRLRGGQVAELEVDAYLHHALYLPPRHRDGLARATNLVVPGSSVPYSRDLRPEEYPPGL